MPAARKPLARGRCHYPDRLLGRAAGIAAAAALGTCLAAAEPAAGPPDAPGAAAAPAGAVSVSMSAEPPRATVGDPIRLAIEIRYPEGTEVGAFSPGREWGSFQVLESARGEPRPLPEGGWVRVDRLTVAAFAPGPAQAPPLEIEFRAPDGSVGRAATPPLEAVIESVLVAGEPREIADLKGPASLPRPLWPWVVAALAAAGAALGAAWALHARRRRLLAQLARREEEPPLPPHEWALRRLAALASSDLLAAGRWLDYHVILAEVVKEYLTRRFGVPTLERTTGEVLAEARAARLQSGRVADLRAILEPCDLVKFARHQPGRAEAEAALARARSFVEATRPPEAATPPAAAAPSRAAAAPEALSGGAF